MEKPRILVVDDDYSIRKYITANLVARDYDVMVAENGSDALRKIVHNPLDLILLDIIMPKVNGFEVCRRVRETSRIPIIMLSAKDDEADQERCFELGADDYLTKPCSLNELLGRIRAVLRRTRRNPIENEKTTFTYNGLSINFRDKMVFIKGKEIKLTRTEYRILLFLAQNAGRVVAPSILLEKVWGEDYRDKPDILWVNLSRLRSKLNSKKTREKYIFTKPGLGYYMRETRNN